MPTSKLEEYLKNQNTRQFSNQTFSDFRQDLLDYANTFYKDNQVEFFDFSFPTKIFVIVTNVKQPKSSKRNCHQFRAVYCIKF